MSDQQPKNEAACGGSALTAGLGMEQKPRTITETDDWKLGCFVDWRPKSHEEECQYCNGKGEVGGGFKDLDGPRECPECFGRGSITKGPRAPHPELPKALVEHMRRAWWDFLNA